MVLNQRPRVGRWKIQMYSKRGVIVNWKWQICRILCFFFSRIKNKKICTLVMPFWASSRCSKHSVIKLCSIHWFNIDFYRYALHNAILECHLCWYYRRSLATPLSQSHRLFSNLREQKRNNCDIPVEIVFHT